MRSDANFWALAQVLSRTCNKTVRSRAKKHFWVRSHCKLEDLYEIWCELMRSNEICCELMRTYANLWVLVQVPSRTCNKRVRSRAKKHFWVRPHCKLEDLYAICCELVRSDEICCELMRTYEFWCKFAQEPATKEWDLELKSISELDLAVNSKNCMRSVANLWDPMRSVASSLEKLHQNSAISS